MKRGRRHQSLKEKVHRDRYGQDAPGYRRPYDAIDVREPDRPAPAADTREPLGAKLDAGAKRRLRRLGIDPDEPETEK